MGANLTTNGTEAKHFHPKGKLPSRFTIELQKGLRATWTKRLVKIQRLEYWYD